MKTQSENSERKIPDFLSGLMHRRGFLKSAGRLLSLSVIGGGLLKLVRRDDAEMVWQLDPKKCVQCGRCATECVVTPSAVKCVHSYEVCGYCKLCGGFHRPNTKDLSTAAENQICPTGAIKRTFIEDPYYEYVIEEELCNGCAKCVKGCSSFGNGSLYLQVRHNMCVGCNECKIAKRCPSGAFSLVPVHKGYLASRESAS